MHEILWINHAIQQIKLLPQKKDMISAGNSVNTHLSLKDFEHLSNFCKILPFWILNLMFELLIKPTHQISAVINCSFLIIIHILTIGKNLNCLLNLSMSLCSSQCRRGHICLRFHKLIICNVIKIEFFMPLLMIITTTFFSRMPFTIFLISCITCATLASIFDSVMKRRDLKAPLASIWVKKKASERGRFRGKSLSPVRYSWSRHDHEF